MNVELGAWIKRLSVNMTVSVGGTARTLPRLTGSNCREAAHRKVHCGDRLMGNGWCNPCQGTPKGCAVLETTCPAQGRNMPHRKVLPAYGTRTTCQKALHMGQSTTPHSCSLFTKQPTHAISQQLKIWTDMPWWGNGYEYTLTTGKKNLPHKNQRAAVCCTWATSLAQCGSVTPG